LYIISKSKYEKKNEIQKIVSAICIIHSTYFVKKQYIRTTLGWIA
jgi:hypothetical protein